MSTTYKTKEKLRLKVHIYMKCQTALLNSISQACSGTFSAAGQKLVQSRPRVSHLPTPWNER